jgi:hypothetical protein
MENESAVKHLSFSIFFDQVAEKNFPTKNKRHRKKSTTDL